VKKIMGEICQIAIKKQIPMPPTIVNDSYLKASNFPFETKTSFQRDYELGDRPDERDLFGGAIIRMGQQYGIKTETTKMIYDSIQKNKIVN
jgi:2-dehydropantoate 2-reductase